MKETEISSPQLAGEEGFEPSPHGPEPRVLPLDYSPATGVLESKIGRFSGGMNGILPLNLPRKTAGIGLELQWPDTLPGPGRECNRKCPSVAFVFPLSHHLEPLCYQSNSRRPRLNYYLKFGFYADVPPVRPGYHIVSDNANETLSLALSRMAPLTLPEYEVEVVL